MQDDELTSSCLPRLRLFEDGFGPAMLLSAANEVHYDQQDQRIIREYIPLPALRDGGALALLLLAALLLGDECEDPAIRCEPNVDLVLW